MVKWGTGRYNMPEVSTWIAYGSKLTFYKSNDGSDVYTWKLDGQR